MLRLWGFEIQGCDGKIQGQIRENPEDVRPQARQFWRLSQQDSEHLLLFACSPPTPTPPPHHKLARLGRQLLFRTLDGMSESDFDEGAMERYEAGLRGCLCFGLI